MKATLLHIMTLVAMIAISPLAMTASQAGQPTPGELANPSSTGAQFGTSAAVSAALPLELTAIDLVSKVYGVLDTGLSEKEVIKEAAADYNLTPSADSEGLWLDSADGYVVSYYGMTPPVSTVAHFDEDGASDFTYFFLFPYPSGKRAMADRQQCQFCGYLLQEMSDLGLAVGVPDVTDSIFEVFGSYIDNHLNVRLSEMVNDDESGMFVVSLTVIPNSYYNSDNILADW